MEEQTEVAASSSGQSLKNLYRIAGASFLVAGGFYVWAFVAELLMPGPDPGGIVVTILLGIAGAKVGGWLGNVPGIYGPDQPAGLILGDDGGSPGRAAPSRGGGEKPSGSPPPSGARAAQPRNART